MYKILKYLAKYFIIFFHVEKYNFKMEYTEKNYKMLYKEKFTSLHSWDKNNK